MENRASKSKGLVWLVLAVLLGTVFSTGLKPLAHVVPWRWEARLGQVAVSTVVSRECHSPMAYAALNKLVKRIYPVQADDGDFSIEVHVVPERDVNAFAAPGGQIVVYSGLLQKADSAEELAGILAHEIEHVRHRHIMEGAITHLLTAQGVAMVFGNVSYAQWSRYFLNMNFTRRQETTADKEGLLRLQKAQVDTGGIKRFFERAEREERLVEYFSDHPSNRARFAMVEQFPNGVVTPVLTQEEWQSLKHICGR